MTAYEIKEYCIKKGISQKELAELMGISSYTLNNATSADKISPQTAKIMELLIKNDQLEKELEKYYKLKEILKDILD